MENYHKMEKIGEGKRFARQSTILFPETTGADLLHFTADDE